MAKNRRSLSDDDLLVVLGATGFCYSAVARITGFSRGTIERRAGAQPLRGRAAELRRRLEAGDQSPEEFSEEAIATAALHAEFSRSGFDPTEVNPSIHLGRITRLLERLKAWDFHRLLDAATNENLLQVYRRVDRYAKFYGLVFRAIRGESARGVELLGKEP